MPTKDLYLFDSSNSPLRVNGISLKLFDAHTGTLLDSKLSVNYNPGVATSNEWGASLSFPSGGSTPVEVYITDPSYRYPGNTVQYLNGLVTDRLDLDLIALPGSASALPPLSSPSTPKAIWGWIKRTPNWNDEERRAVWNLVLNYLRVIVPRLDLLSQLTSLSAVAENWEEALERVGISPSELKQ